MSIARLLAALTMIVAVAPLAAQPRPDLRVMSFNVRYASFDDSPNAWPKRTRSIIETLTAADPDVIATQELLQRQGDDIVAAIPTFAWFARDRFGGHGDEHMGILYRKDRLRLIRWGDFGLSDTPATPGIKAWGTDLPRNATWGLFETKAGRRFVLLDTHFAHRDQDAEARDKSAALILKRLPEIAKGLPVIVAGDFNTTPDTAPYRHFAAALTDSWNAARERTGGEKTFHDFTGTADRRIDYVFVKRFTPLTAKVWSQPAAGRWPSDHFPLLVDLAFEK